MSLGAGLPLTPKKNPGCGFTYACPQRLRMIPAMSRRGSNPPGANMSPSCSRNARSYCANDVPSSLARPRAPCSAIGNPGCANRTLMVNTVGESGLIVGGSFPISAIVRTER